MDQATLLEIFDGVPQVEIDKAAIENGVDVVTFMNETTGFLSSNAEVRRALKENSLSVNKNKITEDKMITKEDVIAGNMILLQRGKKNYFLVVLK